jgi:hypothetical protein
MVHRGVKKQPFDLLRAAGVLPRAFPLLARIGLKGHHSKTVYQYEAQNSNIAPALTPKVPKSRHFGAFSLDFDISRDAGGLPRAFSQFGCTRHFKNHYVKTVYQFKAHNLNVGLVLTPRLPKIRHFGAFSPEFDLLREASSHPRAFPLLVRIRHLKGHYMKAVYQSAAQCANIAPGSTPRLPKRRHFGASSLALIATWQEMHAGGTV